ncbi:Muscle M-line assembly protein unc-89 [Trichinella britovi]|uniref:Muscle M-line assembly protein unc-89 n=1 Tax=Trichinella britovi TaxID=45882 RepID=A0A0V1CXD4_TRIBR|nr:Muscle M-line assembly protein unc-89 [Trichinella britovi]
MFSSNRRCIDWKDDDEAKLVPLAKQKFQMFTKAKRCLRVLPNGCTANEWLIIMCTKLLDLPDNCLLHILENLTIMQCIYCKLICKRFVILCDYSIRCRNQLYFPDFSKNGDDCVDANEITNRLLQILALYGYRFKDIFVGFTFFQLKKELIDAIAVHCTSLNKLDVSFARAETNLVSILREAKSTLNALNIEEVNWIQKEDYYSTLKELSALPKLKELNARRFYSYYPILPNDTSFYLNSSVINLNLSGNRWLSKQQLHFVLSNLMQLKTLKLSCLSNVVDSDIIKLISTMKKLEILELNNISRLDLSLSELCHLNGSLKKLYLRDNSALNDITFFMLLEKCYSMEIMDVRFCLLSSKALNFARKQHKLVLILLLVWLGSSNPDIFTPLSKNFHIMTTTGYTSKYSSYKKYITSSEVSFASNQRRSSYKSEIADEYISSRGNSSRQKEIITGSDTHSLPVYIVTQDFNPDVSNTDALPLEEGQIVEVLDSKNASSWLVRTKARPPKIGWAPGTLFETPTEYYRHRRESRELTPTDVPMTKKEEALLKRNAVFQQLMKSEEVYVSELHHLLETYLHFLDDQSPPLAVRQLKEQLSLNLREIYNFHANVLLKGFQYYSDDPGIVGQTFMRLERDFDHHIKYCHDEPDTEKLIEEPVVKQYFESIRDRIETAEKTLLDYLQLPIKRIQEYQQFLKEMIRYSLKADLPVDSLQKALELMLWIPKRAVDLNFIQSISDLPTDASRLGRLLRHDQFRVWEKTKEGEGTLQYVFLFKSKLVFTSKQESEDADEIPEFKFNYSVRIDKYELKDDPQDSSIIQLCPLDPALPVYYLQATETSDTEVVKQAWVKDLNETKEALVSLAEEETETMTEFADFSDIKSEFSEYSSVSRKSSLYGDGVDDGPPRKKHKTPPSISRSTSVQSLCSMNLESVTQTGSIEMHGSNMTRTQYGYRTLHATTAKMSLKVSGYPLPVITWFKDGVPLQEDERHKFYSDEDGFFAMTIEPVLMEDTGRYTCVATNEYGQATTSAFFRVVTAEREPEKPRFVTVLQDLQIHEGETAKFSCEVEGWPEPEIQFYLDGQAIHPSREYVMDYDGHLVHLNIRDVQPDDAGVISLKILNASGSDECKATLTVIEQPDKRKVPPEFQQVLHDVVVKEDDEVKFKVVCSGDPTPEVVWYVNGTPLTNSDKVNIIAEDGIYILKISNITQHFDGELLCRAINRIGEASCGCHVTVLKEDHAPIFEQELCNQVVCIGDLVKLQVMISASPVATVSWMINEQPIDEKSGNVRISEKPQSGIYVLEILNATTEQNGLIECLARNRVGEAKSQATLSVEASDSPPMFKQELHDIREKLGQPVELQVIVDSRPISVVHWSVNGREITGDENCSLKSDLSNRHQLRIAHLTEDLCGLWVCKAENSCGSATCQASVTAADSTSKTADSVPGVHFDSKLPPVIKRHVGEQFAVDVRVTGEQPVGFWSLNGKRLESSEFVRLTEQPGGLFRLEILTLSEEFSGTLSFEAQGSSGQVVSMSSELIVLPAPSDVVVVSQLPPSITAEVGSKVLVELNLGSSEQQHQQAEITWLLNGQPIAKSDEVQLHHDQDRICLQIDNISENYAGVLTCLVKLGNATETLQTNLEVVRTNRPPAEISGLSDTEVEEGDTIEFKLNIENAKSFQAEWFLNGTKLLPSDNVLIETTLDGICTLKFTKIHENQSGELECRISTPSGCFFSRAQLTVKPAARKQQPEICTQMNPLSVYEGDTLETKVALNGHPEPSVEWFLNGQRLSTNDNVHIETGNGMSSLRVKRVGKEMAGELSCVAKNLYGEVTTRTTLTVNHQIPVEFEQYLCDACCREGDTLKLKAILYGEPSPDVSWYINGKKLVESENIQIYKEKHTYIVVIHDITCDYSGEVVCKAVNEFGEASSSATLSVMRRGVPPDFLEWMNSISAAEGAEVVHRVRFSGDPKPTITWFINHQEIHNSDEFLITTEGDICTLTIKRFSARMVGEIICKAENDAGEVSCTAQMTLGTGRYLREEYSERSELEAVALSTGDIEGSEAGTDFAFSLPDEDMDEDGSRYESSMAPKFISKIKDTKVTIGKQAIFECIVPGSKGICVKWLKDGNEVELLARIRVGSHKEENVMVHRLIIDDVRREDAGYYTCVVMNEHGQETCVAKLEIAEGKGSAELLKPPQFISCLSNVNVKVGDKALFSCKVTGFPQPDLKWYKDGEVIETFDESTTVREEKGTYMLVIDAVEKKHEGEYICEATNVAGQVKTCAELKIQQYTVSETDGEESVAPHFTVPLYPQTVTEGSTADLSCFATGNPEPEIHWYKDEKEIHENDHFKFTSTKEGGKRLIVDNVHIVDEAEYTCEAVNIAGKASTKTILKVQKYEESECDKEETVLPKFTTDLQYQTVREGEQAVLTCVAKGVPSPEIYWFKNDERIQNDSHFEMRSDKDGTQTLIVCKAYLADQAEYKCEARNVVGSSFTQAALKVEKCETSTYEEEPVPPEFSTSLHYQKVNEGEQAVLMCTAKGHPQPEIYWYKNDQQIQEDEHFQIRRESDGRQKLIIVETVIDDQAKYTCEAVNTVGKSTTQTILEIQRYTVSEPSAGETVAPIFTKELEYQKISEGQQAVLTCVAHGQPTPEIHWYKDDEEINNSEHFEMKSEKDGTQKLIVSEVSTNDQAEYRCEAWNTVEYIVSEVESGEVVPPEFTIPLQYQNIYEGQQAVLECALKGHPKPEVRWFKGSEEIYNDEHFEMKSEADGTQKLILLKVSANDDAVYKCEARNVAGESYTEASLQVERYTESDVKSEELSAPEFTSALEYQKVYQGQQAMLKCVAKGQPTPEIHWYKDNEEIHKSEQFEMHTEEDGTQILILSKVSIDDEAEYRCEACNIAGSSYTQATLKVEKYTESEVEKEEAIPPEITTGLEYQKVYEGQQVILSCVAKSHPSPEVHWFKDGEEIQSDEHFQMRSEDDGTYKLIISNAVVDDQAEYKCETWNIAGKASTKTVLEVKRYHEFETESLEDVPPTFTTTLEHQQVYEGEQVVFQCVATGQPAPKISWYKDGEEIFNNEHFLMKSEENGTQTLILLKSSVDDQAEYTCEAWNAAGKSTTQTTLEVKRYAVSEVEQGVVPPEFTTTLEHQSVYEGQQALFTCVAKGYPAPEIHWFKDGVEIESDDHFQMKSGEDGTQILIVTKTCVDDQAEYRCEAWNMGGKSTTQTTLKVEKHLISEVEEPSLVAPEFITNLQYQKVDEGQQAILTCVAKGYPSPEIHWYKDGEEIKNDEHFKMKSEADGTQMLILSKPVIEDQAVYRCEAWNIVGKTSTQTTLDIERSMVLEVEEEKVEAPQFISSLRYDAIREGEQAVLTCVTKGSPVPEVRWYKDEQEITNDSHFQIRSEMDGTQKLIIIRTVKDDQAEYKCEAINVAGRSSTKSIFKIQEVEFSESEEESAILPQFTVPLEYQKVHVGEQAVLTCVAKGQPTPEIHWFKDEVEIFNNEHFEMKSQEDGTQKLILTHVSIEDQANYTCEALNVAGRSSTSAILEIEKWNSNEAEYEHRESFERELDSENLEESQQISVDTALVFDKEQLYDTTADGVDVFSTEANEARLTEKIALDEKTQIFEESQHDFSNFLSESSSFERRTEVSKSDIIEDRSQKGFVPEFVTVLEIQKAAEGATASFSCKVVGEPTPIVRWFKDGNEILESEHFEISSRSDGTQTLIVKSVKPEDCAVYSCEAVNVCGKSSTKTTLEIQHAETSEIISEEVSPSFIKEIESVSTDEGKSIELECIVAGRPLPTVKWYKDGEEITAEDNFITLEALSSGLHRLHISNASSLHDGEYRCIASNSSGAVWSNAVVEVRAAEAKPVASLGMVAPEFIEVLRLCEASEHEVGTLQCKVTGFPAPEVRWFKDGVEITESEKYKMFKKADDVYVLQISDAIKEDEGEYRCEASNEKGFAWSEAPLSVKMAKEIEYDDSDEVAPDFAEPLKACVVNSGEDVVLQCKVTGVPYPDVMWYKKGVPVVCSEKITIETCQDGIHKLIIHQADESDVAEYRCEAKNDAGVVWSDATVCVLTSEYLEEEIEEEIAPSFVHELRETMVKEGEKIMLTCKVAGSPLPEVHWYKNGDIVKSSDEIEIVSTKDGTEKLIIHHAKVEDQGNYRCEAVNLAGYVSSKAPVSVFAIEDEMQMETLQNLEFTQPLHHRISDDDVRSVIFECQVASPSPATVYWYKDGVPIEMEEAHSIESFPDGLQKLILKNVTSEMAGHYTCKVKVNQVEIKTDDDLKVSEAAGLLEFSHGLKNQSVKKGSTVVMKCQINLRNRKQLPTVRWYKSGKEILADKRTEINSFPDGVCTLTITKTEEEDEGNYTCIISDGSSSVKTEATLTLSTSKNSKTLQSLLLLFVLYLIALILVLEEKKLSITKPLEDTVVPFGRDLTLEIEIQGQFESVKWYHGKKELRNSQRVKIEETDSVLSLFVKQADEESAGEYSVVIQMGQETVKSTAQVCVEPIPPLKITEGLTDLTVQLNDALQLSVKLTGLPEKVEWFKDGVKLKNSRTLRMESQDDGLYTLIVQNSSIKDVGRYEFKATNKDGSVESDALIKIKSESDDKPKDEDAALALVKGLTNQNVSDGEPFELRAKFSRKPKEVKWYKSGKQILPSKRVKISSDGLEFILEITDAKEDDSGKYEIEAFDDKGSVNSSADVNVKGTVPLKINDGLKPVELFSGETIRLAVNMVGSPDSVDWFKDGKKLEESANCEFSAANGIYEMTIKNCSMNDKGSYEFQASNSKGDVSSKGIVKIKARDDEKPKDEDVALTLVKGLSDQQINFGDTLELKIKLNRKPHRFIWYKNGKEIEPSPRVKVVEKESEVGLIITDATEDDAGAYKIVAELGSAAVDSSADVAVKKLLQPLKILKPLKDQKCTVGTKITFLVEISDKPQAIRWYKNGKQIAESKRVVMQSMTDKLHKLEIDSAELDDEGIYSVEVENKSGMAKSEAVLNILDDHSQKPSFKILRDLENQQVTQGETVLFSVEFSQVPKTVSWYKHMQKISPDEKIKINFPKSTQCELELHNASLEDISAYRVEAMDEYGNVVSSAAELHVQRSPDALEILKDLEDIQILPGETATFKIQVKGKPKFVKWYKNGRILSGNDKAVAKSLDNGNYILTIKDASENDQAEYKCVLENDFGSVASEGKLTVGKIQKLESDEIKDKGLLKLLRGLSDHSADVGSKVEFSVQLQGFPENISWFANGRLIEPCYCNTEMLPNGELLCKCCIPAVKMDDAGILKFQASNSSGTVNSECTLKVNGYPPKFLRGLTDRTTAPKCRIVLEVEIDQKPNSIKWYKDNAILKSTSKMEMISVDNNTYQLILNDIDRADAGSYSVEVTNEFGSAKSTGKLSVSSTAEKPLKPKITDGLKNVSILEGENAAFSATIEGKPTTVKWYRNGIELKAGPNIEVKQLDDATYKLILINCDKNKEGVIKIVASNDKGSDYSEAQLSIEIPVMKKVSDDGIGAKFVVPLENIRGNEKESLKLTCKVKGQPFPEITWLKDGQPLPADSRIVAETDVDGTCTLNISCVIPDDAGMYACVAQNHMGKDRTECELKVGGTGIFYVLSSLGCAAFDYLSFILNLDEAKLFAKHDVNVSVVDCLENRHVIGQHVRHTNHYSKSDLNIFALNTVNEFCNTFYSYPNENFLKDNNLDVRASEELDSGMAPQFIKPLRSSSVVEGENLILEARIIGNPLPSICWYVNDKEVVPNERVEGKIECIANEVVFLLQIKNARPEDAANYKCEATNPYGTQCSEASVTVEIPKPADQVAPKFVIPLVDMRANEGKTLRAEVKVRGRPTPELTWFKNKVPLTPEEEGLHIDSLGEGRWLLTMNKVTADASGLYECVATNKLGTDQCSGVFTIKPSKSNRKRDDNFYAPVFNVPLHDRRLPEKSVMVIECFVDANPKATIHWYKGDQLLEEDAHVQMETYPDGKCRLRIQYFSECDAGFYRCTAENEIGSATTSAYLSVEVEREREVSKKTEFAPFFTKLLQDTKTSLDLPVCIDCTVKGVPFPEIRWYKDGMAITSRDVKTELFEDGRCCLTIDKVDESNLGAYRCVASNVHGSSSCACMLISDTLKADKKVEQKAPWFSKTLTDTWVEKGSDLMLNCKVDGDFPMEIKWYKDGKLLRPSDRMSMTFDDDGTVTLKILRCSYADEGLYRCVAENSVGTANSMGVVSVPVAMEKQNFILPEGVAPQVIVPLENERCTEGDRLELNCQFSGSDLQIRWFKDGLTISSDGHIKLENAENGWSKLIIPSLMLKDEGSYRCVASNEFGSATTKGFARVEFVSMGELLRAKKPKTTLIDFTVPLRDLRLMDSHPLLLECICSSGETPEIKWYKDGDLLQESDRVIIENLPDGKCTLKIHSCTPDDEGLYRCVAEDSSGSANTKSRVIVKRTEVFKSSFIGEDLSHRRSIAGKAPHFIEPLTSQKLTQGSHLRLVCRVDGDPMPSIRWLKDGDRIYSGGRHQMNTSPDGLVELIITNASPWDSGCYRCLAENEHGSARTISDVRVDRLSKKPAVDWEEEIKHGRAPGFIRPLTVKRVMEGDTITLECLPFGNPFPEIRWLKDGVEVSPNERIDIQQGEDGWQRLIIKDVCLNDDSFYRCVASNEYGTNSTKAQLIVDANSEKSKVNLLEEEPEPIKERLRFKQGLANLTIHTGSPAEFECFPVGSPYPTVQWLKDGVPLVPSDRILTWKDRWGFQRLAILNATIDDEGEYKCTITNDDGMISTEGTLSILSDKYERQIMDNADVASHGREFADRPEIAAFLRHLKNKHVFSGFPVIFDCLVKGSQQMEARWYHNGKLIECNERVHAHYAGGGSYVLIIDSSISSDVGEYVVELSNQFGMISSSAVLDVTVPRLDHMSIDHPMEPCYKYLADVLPRRLHYSSIPTPPDRGPFIAEVSGHFLTLSWIPTKRTPPRYSQVTYIVEMRELPYREWYVVDYNIPQPCCKVRNMEHGKSYQFRIRAENLYGISDPSPPSPPSQLMAPPKPALDKYNRPIPLLDPYAQDAMNKTYGERYGIEQCEYVACAPWFSPQETDRAFCPERGKLVLSMFAHGYPEPEVKWLFRGWEIQPDSLIGKYNIRREGNDEYSLTIYAFSKEDVGQYQCKAVNDHGEAQQNVLVDLAIRPTFIQPLNSKVVQSCKPCRLDCRIDGTPIPEIKWYKDWKPLFETNRIKFVHEPPCMYSLIIETPLLRDSGVYACIASNEAGEVSSTGTVAVEAEPFDY